MILIGLAGKMGAGKDTVASMLADYGFKRFGFADALRDEVAHAIASLDYPMPPCLSPLAVEAFSMATVEEVYAKPTTPRMRALLQEWGTEFRRSQDEGYWTDIMKKKLAGVDRACISDVRFADEAALVRECGGVVWLVDRPGCATSGHSSEALAFDADFIIDNSGGMGDLQREVARTLTLVGVL